MRDLKIIEQMNEGKILDIAIPIGWNEKEKKEKRILTRDIDSLFTRRPSALFASTRVNVIPGGSVKPSTLTPRLS